MNYKRINGFYIRKDEEKLVKYLIPEHFIDKGNFDVKYAKRFLQNELHNLLNSFVNGGFSKKGYLFFPFVKGISQENFIRIRGLKKIVLFLDKNGYDFFDSIEKFKNKASFAELLSVLHQDLYKIKNKNLKSVKKPRCNEFKNSSISPLSELKKYSERKLKPYLIGFYLHGSFATKDYIPGWSDVDTTAIISKETIKNPKKLIELRNKLYYLRKFFYKIDPLQHHGVIAISEYEMENYCQDYFPVPVFNYSKSLFRNDKAMDFKVRDYKNESLQKLFWFVSYFRKLNFEKKINSSYDIKNLLHSATLFPTLYLQTKGNLMYKKFSFSKAKKGFKKQEWEIIDNISSLRSNWRSFSVLPFVELLANINPLLYYQINAKIIDVFDGIKRKNNINTKLIAKKMFDLSEQAWKNVKKI